MRKALVATLALIAAQSAAAQFPGVDLTGGISASVSAPVPCESCSDLAVQRSVGLLIRDKVGVGYRGLRWGDQRLVSNAKMASDLITLDLYWPTGGRARPFVSGGAGHSSARVLVGDGGHAYYDYGPASSMKTGFWGVGLDTRIYRHLAFTVMVSSISTSSSNARARHCTNYNYLSGDFTYTCSDVKSPGYAVRGVSVGVGVR